MGPTGYNLKQYMYIFDGCAASVVRLRPLESRYSNLTLKGNNKEEEKEELELIGGIG